MSDRCNILSTQNGDSLHNITTLKNQYERQLLDLTAKHADILLESKKIKDQFIDFQQRLSSKDAELKICKDENKNLQDECMEERALLEKKTNQMQNDKSIYDEEKKYYDAQLQQKIESISTLRNQLSEQTNEYEHLKDNHTSLQEKYKRSLNELLELEKTVDNQAITNAVENKSIVISSTLNQDSVEEIQNKKEEEYRLSLQNLKDKIKHNESEFQDKSDKMQKNIDSLQLKITSLEQEKETIDSLHRKLLSEKNAEFSNIQNEIIVLKQQNIDSNRQKKELETELSNEKVRSAALQEKLIQMNNDLVELSTIGDAYEKKVDGKQRYSTAKQQHFSTSL